jgi:toxic protein SymE
VNDWSDEKIFFMRERKLKIYPKYRSVASRYSQVVPELRLCGQWLERSGFRIDGQAQVTIEYQEIIIKPMH